MSESMGGWVGDAQVVVVVVEEEWKVLQQSQCDARTAPGQLPPSQQVTPSPRPLPASLSH